MTIPAEADNAIYTESYYSYGKSKKKANWTCFTHTHVTMPDFLPIITNNNDYLY